jgi:hypothetical protein
MSTPDIVSVLTGILGLYTVVIAACRWLSPVRRMRALDDITHRVERLIAPMQEEGLVAYRAIDVVQDAHERLLWSVPVCSTALLCIADPRISGCAMSLQTSVRAS